MKRLFYGFVVVISLFVGTSTALAKDPDIPTLQASDRGWVDTTGTVSSATLESLRSQSARINDEGFQLAGAFFQNIDSDPSKFASDFGNKNGVGYADKDNGLVIIVLLDRPGTDGKKPYIFVATGRGIEGLLNDAKVTRFREQYFNNLRAQGKWEEGLIQLSTAFADFLGSPEAQEFRTTPKEPQAGSLGEWLLIASLVLMIALVLGVIGYFFWRMIHRGHSKETDTYYPSPYTVMAPPDYAIRTPRSRTSTRRRTRVVPIPPPPLPRDPDPEPYHRSTYDDDSYTGSSSSSDSGGSSFGGGFGGGGGSFGGAGSGG